MSGAAASRRPRVFTIPAGAPFLETLADALLSGTLFDHAVPPSAEALADTTLYLPTRRAAQALATMLAARAPSTALLLPRIVLLGDPEPDSAAGTGLNLIPESAALPPAIDSLVRRLELFKLVDVWRRAIEEGTRPHGESEPFFVARSRADAFALAGELANLIDEAIIEGVPLQRLAQGLPADFDPERHDAYWSLTSRFLEIVAQQWPQILAEYGLVDAAQRTRTLLLRHAESITAAAGDKPVIIAGSTGSVAATAELMRSVARLPQGAVILPGLDLDLEAGAWEVIGAEKADLSTRFAHPQATMKRTLARIGIERSDVLMLGRERAEGRTRLASETFRPAESSDAWSGMEQAAVPSGLMLIEAADTAEEALAIALVMREAIETAGRTVALVTPDRLLARAVQSELRRWDVSAVDSAGQRLTETPPGVLARLLLRAARLECGGSDLLSLMRHPLLATEDADRDAVDVIELAALRGSRWEGRLSELPDYLRGFASSGPDRHDAAPVRRISPDRATAAAAFAARVLDAVGALREVFDTKGRSATLGAGARAHLSALAVLARIDPEQPPPGFVPLLDLFDQIEATGPGPGLPFDDYVAIFEDLAGSIVLPPEEQGHARVRIWGLLEARLLDADRIVLGGLSEGIWPPDAGADPFLNRPMRLALGLQPPERRIGQSAHDFQMLIGHPDVILTRSRKRQGSPSVASRNWRRLTACLGKAATETLEERGRRYLDWARTIDRPAGFASVGPPAPRISAALMPPRLNLTEVETLYRDPYAIFARRVLELDPLEPLEPPLDGRERGTLVHEILAAYGRNLAGGSSTDAAAKLLRLGRQAFEDVAARDPVAAHFWWRRLEAFVPWFLNWHQQRQRGLVAMHVETLGRLDLTLGEGAIIRLSTRADRIEQRPDGVSIIDYKTGTAPSATQVLPGLSPQLPLTAALAARGAFVGVPALPPVELSYLRVAQTGGSGKHTIIKPKPPEDLAAVAARQLAELENTLRAFAFGQKPFVSRRMPEKTNYAGDYDLLARYLEWSLGSGDDADGEAPE